MWIPTSVDELRQAIDDGLQESPWLDAKREPGSTGDIAKDVAAMANEGGVLLYGVAEDEHGQLTELTALDPLAGAEERIANAVRDLVHNPPALHIQELREAPDASSGYLVVVVPRSPLAPHMVEGRRGGRYWGRLGTTNARLTGAQVDTLMDRRKAAERDLWVRLSNSAHWRRDPPAIPRPPDWPITGDRYQLVVRVDPAVPTGRLVERARGDRPPTRYLAEIVRETVDSHPLGEDSDPDAFRQLDHPSRWLIGGAIYLGSADYVEYPPANLELEVGRDGVVVLRQCGAVLFDSPPNRAGEEQQPWVADHVIGPSTVWTLAIAGRLYRDAGEITQVTGAVSIDGTKGARSRLLAFHRARTGQRSPTAAMVEREFRAGLDVSSLDLADKPAATANSLLGNLWQALTQGSYPDQAHPIRPRE